MDAKGTLLGPLRIRIQETVGLKTGASVEVAEWLQGRDDRDRWRDPDRAAVDCVPAFPTRSEVWLRLLEAYAAG